MRLRYVELARTVIQAKAGTRFGVGVSADAPVHWRLGGKTRDGEAGPARPARPATGPGATPLVVTVGDHRARATVVVGPRQ